MSSPDRSPTELLVHGIHPVLEALASSASRVRRIIAAANKRNPRLQEVIHKARLAGVPIVFEPVEALSRRAGTEGHQFVLAELSAAVLVSLEDVLANRPPRVLLLDGVEDPRNLGAVLRTAEAVGIADVLLPHRHSCGITGAVVKASAGAALNLRLGRIGNVVQALGRLKDSGYWTVGLDMRGSESIEFFDPSGALAIVVGGEDRGLRRLVRETCDFLVRLPMRGQVPSLNLSVAAGVLLYRLMWPEPGNGEHEANLEP